MLYINGVNVLLLCIGKYDVPVSVRIIIICKLIAIISGWHIKSEREAAGVAHFCIAVSFLQAVCMLQ